MQLEQYQAYKVFLWVQDKSAFNITNATHKKKINQYCTNYYFNDNSMLQVNHYGSIARGYVINGNIKGLFLEGNILINARGTI